MLSMFINHRKGVISLLCTLVFITISPQFNMLGQNVVFSEGENTEATFHRSEAIKQMASENMSSTVLYHYACTTTSTFTNPYAVNICAKFEWVFPADYNCQPECGIWCENYSFLNGDQIPSATWLGKGQKYFTKYICIAPGEFTVYWEGACTYCTTNNFIRITLDEDHDCASPGGACSSW